MAWGMASDIVRIVREMNLSTIKKETEKPFSILLAGSAPLATELAERLSATEGRSGVHPWLDVQAVPLPLDRHDLSGYDLALLVTDAVEMQEAEASTLRRLREDKVPVVVVVVSAAAASQVGAELARRDETARVLLAPPLSDQALRDKLAPALLDAARDELRLPLARQLPPLRAPVIQELVETTSRANALYAASTGLAEVVPILNIPLNAADIFVLTKNQLVMAYKVALAAGKEGTPREIMGEVISVLGGGFLFRQIARELVGLIPVVGVIPKVAIAYGGTWVIGRTVMLWALEGEHLNTGEMRRLYDEAMARGMALASKVVGKVRDTLPALPAPSDAAPTDATDEGPGLLQRVRARLPF